MTTRLAAIFITGLLLALSAIPAVAGGVPKDLPPTGIVNAVDAQTRTIIFRPDGADNPMTLPLDGSVDALRIPVGSRVIVDMGERDGRSVVLDVSKMFVTLTPTLMIALVIIGMVGGMLSGFIGSGGAFVMTPSMMSLGIPGVVALASNMCHKFPKALVGAYKRYRYGQADLKLGLVIGISAIAGVQIGIRVQKAILATWGKTGSDLYLSLAYVTVLLLFGAYVLFDAWRLWRGGIEVKTSALAVALQKIRIPPVMDFPVAGLKLSVWVTVPIGLASGLLVATIAAGGLIGVPGMIYALGATAVVATATQLVTAFVMGLYGAVYWAVGGFVDIRLTLLILAGSLVGIQFGAIGTTYVKDYTIKITMGVVMLIVAVSRAAKVPVLLADLHWMSLSSDAGSRLESVSFWALIAALSSACAIVFGTTIRGMLRARRGGDARSG
ncbi:sulfite exporter TauE/SafE family protein [Verrucomicrobiota bacterium]